jgi:hypothetical protein
VSAQHTPGPWHFTWDGEGQPGRVGVVLPCEPVEHCGYDSHCIALTQPGKFDARANAERIVQCVNAHDDLVAALASARKLLERCGPHLQGVEPECCGNYESDYGAEYMGQREVVPVCCSHPIDLSDHAANELRVIDAALAKATGRTA